MFRQTTAFVLVCLPLTLGGMASSATGGEPKEIAAYIAARPQALTKALASKEAIK